MSGEVEVKNPLEMEERTDKAQIRSNVELSLPITRARATTNPDHVCILARKDRFTTPNKRMSNLRNLDLTGIATAAHPREPWCAMMFIAWWVSIVVALLVWTIISPTTSLVTLTWSSDFGRFVSVDESSLGVTALPSASNVWLAVRVWTDSSCNVSEVAHSRVLPSHTSTGTTGDWMDVDSFKVVVEGQQWNSSDVVLFLPMRGAHLTLTCKDEAALVSVAPLSKTLFSIPRIALQDQNTASVISSKLPARIVLDSIVSSIDPRGLVGSVVAKPLLAGLPPNATSTAQRTLVVEPSQFVTVSALLPSTAFVSSALAAFASAFAILGFFRGIIFPVSSCSRTFWRTYALARDDMLSKRVVARPTAFVGGVVVIFASIVSTVMPIPYFLVLNRFMEQVYERNGTFPTEYYENVVVAYRVIYFGGLVALTIANVPLFLFLTHPCWRHLPCASCCEASRQFVRIATGVGIALSTFSVVVSCGSTVPLLYASPFLQNIETDIGQSDWNQNAVHETASLFYYLFFANVTAAVIITAVGRGIMSFTVVVPCKRALIGPSESPDHNVVDIADVGGRAGFALAKFLTCWNPKTVDWEDVVNQF